MSFLLKRKKESYLLEVRKTAPRAQWYYAEGKFIVTNFGRALILKPAPYADAYPKVSTNFELVTNFILSSSFSFSHVLVFKTSTPTYTDLLTVCRLLCIYFLLLIFIISSPPALQILMYVNAVYYLLIWEFPPK